MITKLVKACRLKKGDLVLGKRKKAKGKKGKKKPRAKNAGRQKGKKVIEGSNDSKGGSELDGLVTAHESRRRGGPGKCA